MNSMSDKVTAKERLTFPYNKTVYGIHNHDYIIFLSLDAAEDYLIEKYPEYCCGKDATIDFCENMIWEDSIENLSKEEN